LPVLVTLLLTAAGAIGTSFIVRGNKIEVRWVLICLAGILATVEAIVVARRQASIGDLHGENARLQRRAEAGESAILRFIHEELVGLETRAHLYSAERVSLFRCEGDHFILVSRRSRNPHFDRSPGREHYPCDEGVLGRAWEDGVAEEPSLPKGGASHEVPRRAWQNAQRSRWNIPEAASEKFVMRSESYVAFRIESVDRALGVIVFESTVSTKDANQAQGPQSTKRTAAALSSLVKDAASRLASLLKATQSIDVAAIRTLEATHHGPPPGGG